MKKLQCLCFIFLSQIYSLFADFIPGKIFPGQFEYPELSGTMNPREAIRICEGDLECAGFTYLGSPDLDTTRKIAFFRFVRMVSKGYFEDVDWTSYMVNRDFAKYINQLPMGEGNNFTEITGTQFSFDQELERECANRGCAGVAVNGHGVLRVYHQIDLRTFEPTKEWSTLFNLLGDADNVRGIDIANSIDYCCPLMDRRRVEPWEINDQLKRASCQMSEGEFTEKFIRTSTPVIFPDCNYDWLKDFDLSPKATTLMFHDNRTTPKLDFWLQPLPGFTHVRTPNSDRDNDHLIMEALDGGWLRCFNRMRKNPNCRKRGTNCSLFEHFPKPNPIPKDLYVKSNFDNDLDWVIISMESTGSHPHNDPDLTGAWNYMINGYKWWVMFPAGFDAKVVHCDPNCSPDLGGEDETFRWYHHVLPQLKKTPIYGEYAKEFVQGPGDSLYLPHGMGHAILNIRDNVAVTENFLFVDALPELMSKIALNEIDMFRPKWEEMGFRKLYYQHASKTDRKAMRAHYDFAVEVIQENPQICKDAEQNRREKWFQIFGNDSQPIMVKY